MVVHILVTHCVIGKHRLESMGDSFYETKKYFRSGLPAVCVSLADLAQRLQQCYVLTTAGKFSEVIVKLRKILYFVPMLIVDSKQEVCFANRCYISFCVLSGCRS